LENARRSLRLLEGLAGKPEAFRKECGKAARKEVRQSRRKECGKAARKEVRQSRRKECGKAAARSAAKPLQGGA